eukprot:scaffold108886_cov29-Phaeocystis_antarctica.AAC.1
MCFCAIEPRTSSSNLTLSRMRCSDDWKLPTCEVRFACCPSLISASSGDCCAAAWLVACAWCAWCAAAAAAAFAIAAAAAAAAERAGRGAGSAAEDRLKLCGPRGAIDQRRHCSDCRQATAIKVPVGICDDAANLIAPVGAHATV